MCSVPIVHNYVTLWWLCWSPGSVLYKLVGQITHLQWTSGIGGWISSECVCVYMRDSTTRQRVAFIY